MQSFDAFVLELKNRNLQCEFATLQDSLIRDMIVIRVIGNSFRERLLRIDNLSLEDAIKIDQAAEATKKHAYELCRSQENQTIYALKSNQQYQTKNAKTRRQCKYCGTLHGKTYLKCKKLDHFASVCLSTQERTQAYSQLQYESVSDDFFIGIID